MAAVNNLLQKPPFQTPTITLESLRENVGKIAQTVGEWLLRTLSGAAGGAIDSSPRRSSFVRTDLAARKQDQ